MADARRGTASRGTKAAPRPQRVNRSQEEYITDRNTVRRAAPKPNRSNDPKHNREIADKHRRERYEQERRIRQIQQQKEARERALRERQNIERNREKARNANFTLVVIVVISALVLIFGWIQFLGLQDQISIKKTQIRELQTELSVLQEENKAYYTEVISQANLEEIHRRAEEDLGMSLPTAEQIQTYTMEGESYVRMYQDLPSN